MAPLPPQFRKFLNQVGIVWNCPTGALAELGPARANALQARIDKGIAAEVGRSPYTGFLTLWKDAGPDIAILKQAKAEYAKLQ